MTKSQTLSRREALMLTGGAAASFLVSSQSLAQCLDALTPGQPEGPFYPLPVQWAQESDQVLTRVTGSSDKAMGQVIIVAGRVLDEDCNPVAGVEVDMWQATARGRYNHESDRPQVLWDPSFQGGGRVETPADGSYWFKTIVPGQYPAGVVGGEPWIRPAHLHYKVRDGAQELLTTQMYFDHDLAGMTLTEEPYDNLALNQQDYLLNQVPTAEQDRLESPLQSVPEEFQALLEEGEHAFFCPFDIVLPL